MAYDLTDFTNFVNRESKAITKTLFAGGDTARFAMFMTGIKGKTEIPDISGGAKLQKGNCVDASGTTKVGLYTIEVTPLVYFEGFCEDDLQNKFPSMVLAPGSNNHDTPKAWQETLVLEKVASIAEQLEVLNWQGDTTAGSNNLYDGLIKHIDAATGVIAGNIGSETAITVSNIESILEGMVSKIPAKVKRTGKAIIAAGDDVFDLYVLALKKANLYHFDPANDDKQIKIAGTNVTLQKVYGLDGTSRMFGSLGGNFVIGTDAEGEEEIIEIWYDKTKDQVYFRSKSKLGTSITNPTEIVEFTLTV